MARDIKSSAGETAKLWTRRRYAFLKLYDRVKKRRVKYGRALNLNYGDDTSQLSGDEALEGFGDHTVNWSWRYIQWLQAEFASEELFIQYPKGADGDEAFADMAQEAIGRVAERAGIRRVLRDVMPELGIFGCCAIHQGFHGEAVSQVQVEEVSKEAGEILEETLKGDLIAKPGQSHRRIAAALRTAVEQGRPVDESGENFEPYGEVETRMLQARAQSHDQQAEVELDGFHPAYIENRRIWYRLGRIGIDTYWNPDAMEPGSEDYIIRDTYMHVDQVKEMGKLGLWRKSITSQLKGMTIAEHRKKDEQQTGTSTPVNVEGIEGAQDENKRVRLLIAEDRRSWKRLIIADEAVGNSKANYLLEGEGMDDFHLTDDEGEPLFPGFFSTKIVRPLIPPIWDPIRMFGVPMLAPMWSQQMEANRLSHFALEDVKRHTRTLIGYNPMLKDKETIKARLEAGEPSIAFELPPNMKANEAFEMFQFTGDSSGTVLGHLGAQKQQFTRDWRHANRKADLTSPVPDRYAGRTWHAGGRRAGQVHHFADRGRHRRRAGGHARDHARVHGYGRCGWDPWR